MEYVKIVDFCKNTENSREEVDAMIEKLGVSRIKIGNAYAITKRAAARIDHEINLPEELQQETLNAKFLHDANNKRYVFAQIEGVEGKQAVLIPRRFAGKLRNKNFKVERIEDNTGVSYRHEDFLRYK